MIVGRWPGQRSNVDGLGFDRRECYSFLAKLRAANPAALGELLRTRFGEIPEITSTRTTIVLETIEEISNLPVPDSTGPAKFPAHLRKRARARI